MSQKIRTNFVVVVQIPSTWDEDGGAHKVNRCFVEITMSSMHIYSKNWGSTGARGKSDENIGGD